ncbi:hypothetical protein K7X08_019067 [Anisodus acutangulus]|uniref:Uncharacterized protein n=1 Tax=Anisodus acutangulus TaxID=402998 RepID=A0A9Q1M0H7_9SOLA|nr:hypothetical protein K7X08_019067 [Anisodus acutangulus]
MVSGLGVSPEIGLKLRWFWGIWAASVRGGGADGSVAGSWQGTIFLRPEPYQSSSTGPKSPNLDCSEAYRISAFTEPILCGGFGFWDGVSGALGSGGLCGLVVSGLWFRVQWFVSGSRGSWFSGLWFSGSVVQWFRVQVQVVCTVVQGLVVCVVQVCGSVGSVVRGSGFWVWWSGVVQVCSSVGQGLGLVV